MDTPSLHPIFKQRSTVLALIFVSLGFIVFALTAHQMLLLSADPKKGGECYPVHLADSAVYDDAFERAAEQGDSLAWLQRGGSINDASCLNSTEIHGIVAIRSDKDVENAVQYAQENDLRIAMSGARHSMGGQAFAKQALVLDMRPFNQIHLDEATKTVTVQPGATWHDIQNHIHPQYAVLAMQSTDIFTVGGSISVNAHGMDHRAGSVAQSLNSMRIMLADGSIVTASRDENTELFRHVVGGYGLFGIILEAELNVTENEIYDYDHALIKTEAFPEYFQANVLDDPDLRLFYGHLSTAPSSLFEEMLVHRYEVATDQSAEIPPLSEASNVKLKRLVLNLSKKHAVTKEIKWWAEKHVDPILASCTLGRSQAMGDGEACLVSRNEPMHDSVPYLFDQVDSDTDILHEYYVPQDQFSSYVTAMKAVLKEHDANLMNASVRVVHKEDMALNYAPEEGMIAIVLYLNQSRDDAGNAHMRDLTQALIDTTLEHEGTFFLPYQLHYSKEQLKAAYPTVDAFFETKRQYDPDERFSNTFYKKYGTAFSEPSSDSQ